MTWKNNIVKFSECLSALSVTDSNRNVINQENAFLRLKSITETIRKNGNKVYLVGNGASASMASHVSADLAKNAEIQTEVFTDLSLITAIANDISYEDVFSVPLQTRMKKGDMLVCISSSGNSKNILKAVAIATQLKGFVLTLSAMKFDNPLRSLGDMNFYVPAESYGLAETCHNTILHYWIDMLAGEIMYAEKNEARKPRSVIFD